MRALYKEWLTEEGLIKLAGYARDGGSVREIADAMGISRHTLLSWRKKFPEIEEALKVNKEIADRKVETAMFDKCIGFTKEILEPVKVKRVEYDPNGKKISETETFEYVKKQIYVPPDVKAQVFWLINRMPDKWKNAPEKKEEEITGAVGVINIAEVIEE